eukprot:gene27481-4787_t
MLDYFGIFSRGGALLWTLQFTALRHSPVEAVNALIRSCLLEERSSEQTFTFAPKSGAHQALKWTFHNGLGLVFVAVYQKTLSLLYVDELLEVVKDSFVQNYKPGQTSYKHFDEPFNKLLRECESKAEALKRPTIMRSGAPQSKGKAQSKATASSNGIAANGAANGGGTTVLNGTSEDDDLNNSGGSGNTEEECSDGSGGGLEVSGKTAFDVSKFKSMRKKGGGAAVSKLDSSKPPAAAAASKRDEPKKMRNWNSMKGTKSSQDPSKLDFSVGTPNMGDEGSRGEEVVGVSQMDEEEAFEEFELDEADFVNNNGARGKGAAAAPATRGVLGSFLNRIALNVVGKGALSAEDLEQGLVEMKRKLMERNVAEQIAQSICDSVGQKLEGQKLSSFTGMGAFVKAAFEDALSGVLNKRQVDLLLDIKKSQARGRPYVIVFCGVNGVGKSTNLAKIAYWLGQHGIKVTIAACDTFRAGAVEQLKTHCARLKVPLYERGYEKDPAKVALEAVKQAERDGRDVVLVDTAGRMQDNEPLMRSLSSLINVNEPNLVLFVGEALVGNDAVDQLVKFNRALCDLAGPTNTRRQIIDGIVLTKFDTIDDKVGAAVSMVYSSGAPVMFVGCGQTYVDLKRLNVKSVVNSLLK